MSLSIYRLDRDLILAENRIREAQYSNDLKASLLEFEDYLFSEGLSVARILKYMTMANVIATQFPNIDYRNLSETNLIQIIGWIERNKKNGNTKNSYKYTLRKLLAWQKKEDHISKVKINPNVTKTKLPEEMFTETDIKNMIIHAENPRDRAFIAVLYETGSRISEHGNPQIKHAVFDKYGASIIENGKTGMRRIRIVWSVQYLIAWINIHPMKGDPEAPLWVTLQKPIEHLKYDAICRMIKRTAKKAGIQKRVHNHLFRHSRCTHVANTLSESQMKPYFGWTSDSKMPKIYIHLSGEDVDNAILNIYGLKKTESEKIKLNILSCPRCKQTIPDISEFCPACGMVLTLEASQRLQELETLAIDKMVYLLKKYPELSDIFKEI
ncbi:tyrosine-type recombinase/integrase [Methanolapillus millepedarum]|uniref:Tyrosine recombinase XerC n=1 Tax=Methanolapillus millepedarum TaxID=3028296 RepID=A0AA96VBM8_9EURY|nr:Tyrosine recombinase XerC [Methanosarcinaceae archaeon Ac7]